MIERLIYVLVGTLTGLVSGIFVCMVCGGMAAENWVAVVLMIAAVGLAGGLVMPTNQE